MNKKKVETHTDTETEEEARRKTPTFLLELPLVVNEGQAKRIRGHLEAGRQFYNAFEQELWQVCAPFVQTQTLMHTLCERVERFLPELFVFVAYPGVPSDNNLAERSVRPLVIARKISGGTRSPKGSATRMGLASLFGTWAAQGLNPFHQCLALLTT